MSTRGLMGHKLNGQYHGTYNHDGSYPAGLGKKVIDFILLMNKAEKWEQLINKLPQMQIIDENKDALPELAEHYEQKFGSGGLWGHSKAEWYNLLRKLQGTGYYWAITEGMLEHMPDNIDFIRDSLFCEYAYIINLDDMTLELYCGWQKKMPPNSPFKRLKGNEYAPCKKIGEMKLADITNADQAYETMSAFYRAEEGNEAEK